MAKTTKRFVICVSNEGYKASLERGKIYVALPNPRAEKLGQICVIDESDEGYLYAKDAFIEGSLPESVQRE